jgi:uncharacterized damage-inducible protein DinB
MNENSASIYEFLLDTYRTEILKITGLWAAFPESAIEYRPHPKSRSVIEQMEHQVQSEERWMRTMLGISTGDPNPARRGKQEFIEKYCADARERLEAMQGKPDAWWQETTNFFDVMRPRAWVLVRRIDHSAHHRGQLGVYLRLLDLPLPSVYGPTADTGDQVIYSFEGSGQADH